MRQHLDHGVGREVFRTLRASLCMSCGRIVQPCHKRSILIEVTCFPGNASGNPAVGRMHSDGRFASFFDLSSLVTSNA
jgi:hypothetical protein